MQSAGTDARPASMRRELKVHEEESEAPALDEEEINPWLGDGWVRDHHEGMLHRLVGESARGPDGVSGWSDRKLLSYVKDYENGDPARIAALAATRTRADVLHLADAWRIPYLTEHEWEGLPLGDDTWHQRPSVELGVSAALPKRLWAWGRRSRRSTTSPKT